MKSSVPSLLNFYQEWTLDFVKCFFWTVKVIISFCLVLSSVCGYVNTEWLLNVKPTVFLGFSPSWPWYVILSIQFWIWFAKFFFEFCICVHDGVDYSLLVMSVWFWYHTFLEWVEEFVSRWYHFFIKGWFVKVFYSFNF